MRPARWCIQGSEGHDAEGEEFSVGSSKAEFGSVALSGCNLVEAGFGIDVDPVESACTWGKVVDGLIAVGHGKVVSKGDTDQAVVGCHAKPAMCWLRVFSSVQLGTCNEPHSGNLSIRMAVAILQ